jgi:hypothetical protein
MTFSLFPIITVVWEVDIVYGIDIDTAYAKDPLDGKWYDCDDSRVSPLQSPVMTKAAYLLFYRRRNHKPDHFQAVLDEANELRAKELEQRKLEQASLQPSYPTPAPPPPYSTSWTIPGPEPNPLHSAVATANNSREASDNDMDEDASLKAEDDDDFSRISRPDDDTSELWSADFSKEQQIREWPVEKVDDEGTEDWHKVDKPL